MVLIEIIVGLCFRGGVKLILEYRWFIIYFKRI